MVIQVLDSSFNLIDVVDNYTSVIWRPAYYDIGDFELYVSASPEMVALLQKDRYLVRDVDISVTDGVATYKKVMIIKKIQLKTDAENGDFLTVTGKELKWLLHQRIVWGRYIIRDTVEYALRRLIGANAVDPVEPTRAIPNMQHAEPKGYSERIDVQISNKQLDEAVIEVCKSYGYGWDVYITDKKLTVDIYKGVDRSYNQTERAYVVFGDSFDNLLETEYVYNGEAYANMALVGGEGEGNDRFYAYVNNEVSGLERYEVFVDARDITQETDTGETLSHEEYSLLLEERGNEKLAGMTETEGFTGSVLDVSFKYGEDFGMGDIVTVINEYGISKDTRVVSVIESQDETGVTVIPHFNI